ncbi:hypothetical protein E6C60_1070 [Paenibacillus algicola]|uniref:Uncharacterized protein n=1 Tax=Paenibacillus algicola TaxID=2565926 RepID=A0A4P8XHJ2_9BACL|nr:hypothetical protein E6C60_1070 [Paenibacillus algicola]
MQASQFGRFSNFLLIIVRSTSAHSPYVQGVMVVQVQV